MSADCIVSDSLELCVDAWLNLCGVGIVNDTYDNRMRLY